MTDELRDDTKMSDDARALLRAEKNALGAAPGKDRVRARLEGTLFGPPGGGGSGGSEGGGGGASASPTGGARWMSHALIGLGGVITGIALTVAVRKPEVVQVQGPPTVVSVFVDRAAPSATPDVTVVTSAAPSASAAPTASASAGPRRQADDLAEERAMLDPARTALGRGDGASALLGVKKHEQRFPKGQLTEEREAIAVQALVALGRGDEARARGERFERTYPNSVLAPAVNAALDAIPK